MIRTTVLTSSLLLALSLNGAATAQHPEHTDANGRASVDAAHGEIKRQHRAMDPKFQPGWERFCADKGENASCEVVMRRLGRKPVIGVLLAPDPQGGVRISGVTPDGPASKAGLRSGDRLLRIGGKAIAGDTPDARIEAARALLGANDDKTPIKLTYARDGRESEVSVTPSIDSRVMIFSGNGEMLRPGGRVRVHRDGDRTVVVNDGVEVVTVGPGHGADGKDGLHVIAGPGHGEHRVIRIECKKGDQDCKKQVETRLGADGIAMPGEMFDFDIDVSGEVDQALRQLEGLRFDCKPGESCNGPLRLAEAFRWNGLNLASVDAQLGRYFGTDRGVLVLSAGPALGELQPGDVIQRIDGKAVATPRAVMDALRDKPTDSSVSVDYLRDRKAGSVEIKVPKPMEFPMHRIQAPKQGAAPQIKQRREIVMVDGDGQVSRWVDDGEDTPSAQTD